MENIDGGDLAYLLISLFCCILIFIGDLTIPRGYFIWLLYIVPLMIIYRAQNTTLTGILLGIITGLMTTGFFLSSGSDIPVIVSALGRMEAMVAFVAFTLIVNYLIVSRGKLLIANEETKKKADELAITNKELEAFSYSVSHDLRSPLRIINGFAEILREDYSASLDESGQEYIDRIGISAKHMETLIQDLLNLSKISRYELVEIDIDISKIATSILSELEHSNPERKVIWHIQDNLSAKGDYRLISIALSNLLGNAWKYTGKKEKAEIVVGAKKQDDHTIFYVRDNGDGFNMKYADNIFKPFRRLHAEGEFAGTGIGLATVERIIARHSGSIWCESEIGKGATFYFTLGWRPE